MQRNFARTTYSNKNKSLDSFLFKTEVWLKFHLTITIL